MKLEQVFGPSDPLFAAAGVAHRFKDFSDDLVVWGSVLRTLKVVNFPEVESMPRLNSTAPCFAVADVGETMRWYEKHLGFAAHPFPKDEPHAFCILVRDQIEIMLQRIDDYEKPNLYDLRDGGVWDAYIRMQGVAEFYQMVRDQVEVLRALEQQFYGDWEFEVRDCNGYVLVLSELK